MVTLPEKPEQNPTEVEEWDDAEPHDNARPLRPHTLNVILKRYKALRKKGLSRKAAAFQVAEQMGYKGDTIYKAILRLQPTTELAQDYIAANSFRLAVRAVRKANVSESMDILSRSNVGVLAPVKSGGGDGGPQFVIGVSVDSLGAVRVGISDGGEESHALPETTSGENIIDVGASFQSETAKVLPPRPRVVPHPEAPKVLPPATTTVGRNPNYRRAVQKAEEKALAKAAQKEKQDTKSATKDALAEIRRRAGTLK